jgi:RNA recognition motif-containing protein
MEFENRSGTLGEIQGGSFFEVDEENAISSPTFEEINYGLTQVLLLKKVAYEASEMDVINLCRRFGVISDIYLVKIKGYAFVQFQSEKQAKLCHDVLKREGGQIKNENVFVFYTGKKEIYKQDISAKLPSRSLLLMFSENSELITNHFANKLLGSFGWVKQLKLVQTQPPSAYAEMDDIGAAIAIKETLDNTVHANSFMISIVYSHKQLLMQQQQPDQSQFHFSSLQSFPTGFEPSPSVGEFYPPGMNIGFTRSEGALTEFLRETEGKARPTQNSFAKKDATQQKSLENLESSAENTVLVKNLPRGIICWDLFKLFGLYGNVMKVKIFYTNPENALIEFQDENQALVAKHHLNNCSLRGNNLLVTISKNRIIFNVPFIPEGNKFLGDYSESKEHRYKVVGSKNFKNIAPPSKVVHLSNLCDNKSEEFYKILFRNCGRIKKFLPLKGDLNNLLMEMESVQQAVEVVMNFHNFNIEGKFLKVSFSKYQTIRD